MIKITFLEDIKKGGSSKRVFRVRGTGIEGSLILIQFNDEEEFRRYLKVNELYRGAGIKVPQIYEIDKERKTILIEDGGNLSLREVLKSSTKESIFRVYRKVIDELLKIQRCLRNIGFPELNEERVLKDLYYYTKMRKIFYNDIKVRIEIFYEMFKLFKLFYTGEKCAVYRDFQSENILWNGGRLMFVDFQDTHWGYPFYDLASLLEDPYMEIAEEIKFSLLNYYYGEAKDIHKSLSFSEFYSFYKLFSVIRLLQARAAYINLGVLKGKEWFLKFIEPSGKALFRVIREFE